MLHGIAPVANATDLTDPTQAAQATRAGETIHAVDQYIGSGSHPQDLLNIAGTDHKSLGQLSPELTRDIADANRPYIDDMMNHHLDHTRGFEALDPADDPQMRHTRDLFAVIDTDSKAADVLNSQANIVDMGYQGDFERAVVDGRGVETGELQRAGTLEGVMATSSNIAANDVIADKDAAALAAYHNREYWLELAKSLGGEIPGVKDVLDRIDKLPGDPLHGMFIGPPPDPSQHIHVQVGSTDTLKYWLAQHLLAANQGDPSILARYVDPNTGQLLPYAGLNNEHLDKFRSAVDKYLLGIDPLIQTGPGDYHEGYKDALPTSEGHTGK